jgi:hypothetical protein
VIGLHTRRCEELEAKLSSLDRELLYWKEQTQLEATGLRRHHSQVRRLSAMLEGVLEPVRGTLATLRAQPAAVVLARAQECENELLAAHAVWEVFRSKLVLRQSLHFRSRLAAADDLAFACYAPAMTVLGRETKAAPLVYLTSTWSPFAQSRDANFVNEVRAGSGTSGALTGEIFQQVLRRLPVPLVGLPWYQAFYGPGAVLLAHEVGHVVQWDFALTDAVDAALAKASLKQADVWTGWASEIFADMYGCVAMGPAFVGALIDFLSGPVEQVRQEERRGGVYPPRALRVELAVRALEQHGYRDDAARLRASWQSAYGPVATMTEFLAEADAVVAAVCSGPYGGRTLADIVAFPHATRLVAFAADYAAAGDGRLSHPGYGDPRLLFAAAQALHEQDGRRDLSAAYDRLTARATAEGEHAFRHAGRSVTTREELDADLAAEEARDFEAGLQLRALLLTPGAGDPPPAAGPPGRPAP